MEDLNKISKDVEESLNGLASVFTKIINELATDQKGKIIKIQRDTNKILKSLKEGDSTQLTKLFDSYADKNSK